MLSNHEVYWRCRRGMLELDLFLLPFFEQRFNDLSVDLKSAFIDMLELPDPDLLNLLMENEAPEEKYRVIIAKIRAFKLKQD